MPDIELVRSFSLPLAIAKSRVQKTVEELDAEYGLRSDWEDNTLRFDRTGLQGEIHVSHSEIRLHVNLSFLLKPLKAELTARIEDKFDRLFPETKTPAHAGKSRKKIPSR